MLNIEDFKNLDLRIGKIISVERVEGSEKLLKLEIDIGDDPSISSGQGTRQIIAGIAKQYAPEEIVGKEVVIVINLEPRVIMNLESNGMILCADSPDGPVLLQPEKSVPPGTKIR